MSVIGFLYNFGLSIDDLLENAVYQNCDELHVEVDGVLIKICDKELKIIE